MKKVNLIIDVARCHDCNNCFVSCKDEHWENDHLPVAVAQPKKGHRWMDIDRLERGQYPLQDVAYLPHTCMHCDDPACMKGVTDGSVYKRPDGIVIIDPVKAKGKKDIAKTCPYGAIYWNEERNVAQKCTMCAHLLDKGWKQPRCTFACATGAMKFVMADDAEMAKIQKEEGLEVLHPEWGQKPRVYYKNLYRFTKCHIAGTVAVANADECVEGAEITVTHVKSNQKKTAKTNNFGDFKIDGLDPESGVYKLEVKVGASVEKVVEVDLKASINVGALFVRDTAKAGVVPA